MKLYETVPRGVLLFNAGCLLCPRRAPLVMLDVQVPGDGYIGLCPVCVTKVARLVGLVSQDRAAALVNQVEELTAANIALRDENRSCKEQLAGLATHLGRYASVDYVEVTSPAVDGETRTCPDCQTTVDRRAYGGHRAHCPARQPAG